MKQTFKLKVLGVKQKIKIKKFEAVDIPTVENLFKDGGSDIIGDKIFYILHITETISFIDVFQINMNAAFIKYPKRLFKGFVRKEELNSLGQEIVDTKLKIDIALTDALINISEQSVDLGEEAHMFCINEHLNAGDPNYPKEYVEEAEKLCNKFKRGSESI